MLQPYEQQGETAPRKNARAVKPLLFIAGAGVTGSLLTDRAKAHWRVTLVDPNPSMGEKFVDQEGVEFFEGDATSTLCLRKAGVEQATCVVATTGSDEVNLEVCRLARERFGVERCLALVHEPEQGQQYEELGIRWVSRAGSVASIIESQLDTGRRTTADIGLGQGEIYEVTVQPHSPVVGKSLAILRPQSWLLGAIYRKGKLVVPHGKTKIEADDRCLLIGEPDILPGIADYFQRGSSEFPLQFGKTVALVAGAEPICWDEVTWLVEHSAARSARLLVPKTLPGEWGQELEGRTAFVDRPYALDGRWPTSYKEVESILDVACLALTAPPLDWRDRFGFGNRALMDLLDETYEPVLLTRSSHPYRKILVAVSPGTGAGRATELAVDIARKFEATLTAVGVCPADIVGGEETREELSEALNRTKSVASLYNQQIELVVRDGNPVRQVVELSKEFDLLVIAHRHRRQFSLTKPDVSRYILLHAACSTIVLPFGKEAKNGG